MLRYIRTKKSKALPQAVSIKHGAVTYYPVFQHAAIDQDRPVGESLTYREHSHDLYHIVLYTKSQGYYIKHGKRHSAGPGTLAIISPGQRHDFVSLRGTSVYSEITFSYESQQNDLLILDFEEVLKLYSGVEVRIQREPMLSPEAAQEMLIAMIQTADYLNSPSGLSSFYAQRTLGNIFEMILTHCCRETAVRHTILDDRVVQVKEYIEMHYTESIRIDEMVALSHCSKGHLFGSFKKAYRISPLAYQQNLRMEAAQTLLRSTDLRCNEIAHRVGYSNVQLFHRLFRKKIGLTPNQYRKSMNYNTND